MIIKIKCINLIFKIISVNVPFFRFPSCMVAFLQPKRQKYQDFFSLSLRRNKSKTTRPIEKSYKISNLDVLFSNICYFMNFSVRRTVELSHFFSRRHVFEILPISLFHRETLEPPLREKIWIRNRLPDRKNDKIAISPEYQGKLSYFIQNVCIVTRFLTRSIQGLISNV